MRVQSFTFGRCILIVSLDPGYQVDEVACAQEEEGLNNQYLHMRTRRRMDEKAYDAAVGTQLWKRTETLANQLKQQTSSMS